jgi:hypothetical protein
VTLLGDGLVAGGRRIHEKLCSDGHAHRGPEVEGGGALYIGGDYW